MSTRTLDTEAGHGRNFHGLTGAGAVLYIAESDELNALKIGVTSRASRTNRTQQHARHGWRITAEITFEDGQHAFTAEQAVLAFLRSCGARRTLAQEQLPQGGYTETVALAREVGLSADQLLVIARAAGEIVEATARPFYTSMVALDQVRDHLREVEKEYQVMKLTGSRRELQEFAAQVLPLLEELKEMAESLRSRL
ncbi:hypothetical protein [Kitasatospora phosalacinea]|uniref:hypothetical protein n=1 Tax=Kitasatospora phosalacinea TaxID=2065 RepID=UPI00131D1617|nr:hypothetical protein [Kitasatospora phosalacinea]